MADPTFDWLFSGESCAHPGVLAASIANQPLGDELPVWQRANSYECPNGPEPGQGWVLMPRAQAKGLDQNAIHSLVINSNFGSVTLTGLVITDVESMFGLPGDDDSPMLVSFEDRRNFAKRSSINKGYNVRIPAPPNPDTVANRYYPTTIDGQSPWTWQKMLADIWGELPTQVGAAPTLPDPPDTVPEDFRFFGTCAWDALHVALGLLGYTTAFDPIADSFSYVRPEAAAVAIPANRLMQDFDPVQTGDAGSSPANIACHFHKRSQYHGTEADTPRENNWEADPVHTITVAGVPNGIGTIAVNGDIFAYVDHTGSITAESLAAMTERASTIAEAVIANVDLERRHVISGPTTLTPANSAISRVTWRDYGDSVGQVSIIEFVSMAAGDGGQSGGERRPAWDSIKPGDYGRRTHPTYPRLLQVVEAYDEQSQSQVLQPQLGKIGSVDTYLHRGRVKLVRDGIEALEDCFILVLKDFDNANGNVNLVNRSHMHGRLSGTAERDQETLPLYSVESATELVLLSPVSCFKSWETTPQDMYLWKLDNCEWVITDTVVKALDPNDTNFLVPGETQSAQLRSGCDVEGVPLYDLVGSRGLLRRVKANADIECGAIGSAIVHEVVACAQETETQCNLDVCNTWGNQQCIADGDEHEVEYLKRGVWTPRYRRNSIYKAVLSSDMCPDNPQTSKVAVEQVEPMDYCESEAALALITEFENENNHAGLAGDTVYGFRDNTVCDGKIFLFDVKMKCQDLAAPIDYCDGGGQFIFKDGCQSIQGSVRKKSAIESCTVIPVLADQIPLTTATVYRSAMSTSNCVVSVLNYATELCVLDAGDEGQPTSAGGLTFGTDVAWQNLQLELDKGGQGSGSGECSSPTLKLTGARIPVLTLTDCGEYGTEQETLHSLALTEQDVVASIDASGCLTWVNSIVLVIGTCGPESQEEAECQEYVCPSGSGSGSG